MNTETRSLDFHGVALSKNKVLLNGVNVSFSRVIQTHVKEQSDYPHGP
jgi:hypothetical protein